MRQTRTDSRPRGRDRGELLAWLVDEAHVRLRASRWAGALVVDGVDVLDALVSTSYRALLAASDGGGTTDWPRWAAWRARAAWRSERTRGATDVAPADVVMWPRHANHLHAQLPVAAALRARGASVRFVACQPAVLAALATAGEKPLWLNGTFRRDLWKARARSIAAERHLVRSPGVDLGGAPAGLSARQVETVLREVLVRQLAWIHEAVAQANGVVRGLAPRALVVGDDLTQEGRVGCAVARAAGVSSAVLMHGTVSGAVVQRHHVVDAFLVYGEADRRTLATLGADTSRVAAVGAPYLDRRPVQSGVVHAEIAARFGVPPGKPWALWATSGAGLTVSRAGQERAIEAVVRLSAARPDITFVAKLHHQDDPALHAAVAARVPGARLQLSPAGSEGVPRDIFAWLQGCPLLLANVSTVAVEAMLLGIPVVTMDLVDEVRGVGFIDAGATRHARDESALAAAVDDAFAHGPAPRAAAFLADTFGTLDGGAAARAADAILGRSR